MGRVVSWPNQMRAALVLAFSLLSANLWAQADSSLTDEFGKLSAKERARVARKEQEEAAQDRPFQEVMATAEQLFQQRLYDESLERFKEARRLRPLNVYPKVKIQDLQALIAKRDAEERAVIQPPPQPEAPLEKDSTIALTETMPTTARAQEAPELAPTNAPVDASPAAPAPVKTSELVTHRKPAMVPVAQPEVPSPRASEPALPEGVTERSFLEGRAVVLERRVVHEGRETVYRRVAHPWGQVVHFRDEQPISEREWSEAFPAR